MKNILALSLVSLALPLSAAPTLEGAFAEVSAAVRQAREEKAQAAAVRSDRPVRESYADVNACWSRPAQEQADALGLPRRFCIRRAGVAVTIPYDLPFSDGSAMIVEGEPASGRFHISGGSRGKDGWNIVGDLFHKEKPAACGEFNMAFAAVYVDIDLKGNILPTTPVVRGFLMDGSSLCCQPAKSVEILYTKEG